jgi:hypothetical protein
MNSWTAGLAISKISLALWLTTGLAAAQPPPYTPGPAVPPATPVTEPAPAPPVVAEVRTPDDAAGDAWRPAGLAFGIGVGYVLPTSLQTPNATSVRLRLPSGLTLEPQLVLASSSNDVDSGGGTATNNKQTELTLASLIRYPVRAHRKVDFEAIGTVAISSQTSNPEGDDNDRTTTVLDVGYGVGLAYWFTRHWNLSLTATNPLITYVRLRQDMGPGVTATNKTTTVGLVFDPTVALMIHLYD